MITDQIINAETIKQSCLYLDCGGLVIFEGVVRNHNHGRGVKKINYEAYIPMAEEVLLRLINEIENKWSQCHIKAQHRIGHLNPGDVAVAVVVWAPHRREAFLACQEMIDRIKLALPIWKQEFYTDGICDWVRCDHALGDCRETVAIDNFGSFVNKLHKNEQT